MRWAWLALDRLPRTLLFYAVEAARSLGVGLSPSD